MSTVQRSVIVSPCYAIEDLPKDGGPEFASDFLNAWIAGWDPRLLSGLNILPEWKRNDSGSLDLENTLVVVPEMSRNKVDIPQRERLQLGRCVVVDSNCLEIDQLSQAILAALKTEGVSIEPSKPLLLDQFYALGYMVLQVQILARKLRYSWNLDWLAFSEQVLAAAKASVNGNEEETERWLQASFDSLSQERDRYCSQQIHLLDVVLLAPTTLGESLQKQLASTHPHNYLANAALLQKLKSESPNLWEQLQKSLASHTSSIIGGLSAPAEMNYATYRGLDRAFSQGRLAYEELGLKYPTVFSQFEPGTGAILPDLLLSQGFKGTLLNAWSGGKVPTKDSAKIRWQAQAEATPIDCVTNHVADASSAETVLHFANHIAKQLDYHHVPTLVLAHWPGATTPHLQLLTTALKRSPALGVFETVEKYFSGTNQPYGSETYVFRQFSSPLSADENINQTLHRTRSQLWQLQTRSERLLSTAVLWKQVFTDKVPDDLIQSLYTLDDAVQQLGNSGLQLVGPSTNEASSKIAELSSQVDSLTTKLQSVLVDANGIMPIGDAGADGYLLVNTANHPRRIFAANLPGNVDAKSSKRIFAAYHHKGFSHLIADLPPFGFVKVNASGAGALGEGSGKQPKPAPQVQKEGIWGRMTGARALIADSDWTLSNEYMEVQIDPNKGHLRSVFVPSKRGSRISGMPSIVLGKPVLNRKWNEEDFLVPTKTSMKLVEGNPLRGVIEVKQEFQLPSGKLIPLLTRYTLWKGARWIGIEIESPASPSGEFHCVWRTAWANESALISSWQQGTKGKLPAPLQGTVELIEIDDAENKTYLATYGHSIHNKWGHRYLVTQLQTQEDGSTQAKLSIGMDWARPLESATDLLENPLVAVARLASTTTDEGAWLAQSNLPNISLQFEKPGPVELIWDEKATSDAAPDIANNREIADATLWVHETRGRRAVSKLSFFKPVEEAWRIDSRNRPISKLDIENGQVLANLRPSEQCRIAIQWSRSAQ